MNIVKSNGRYSFYNEIEIIKKLEVKNYVLRYDPIYYICHLEEAAAFSLPLKLYNV